jgi:hypothetical protein
VEAMPLVLVHINVHISECTFINKSYMMSWHDIHPFVGCLSSHGQWFEFILGRNTTVLFVVVVKASVHNVWHSINKTKMMLRKRPVVDSNEPVFSDYDYAPKLDDGYSRLRDGVDQLKVHDEKEKRPATWFWNTLFVFLGFVTHYFRIWAGDFVL